MYRSIQPSIYLFDLLTVCQSIHPFVYPSIYLSIYCSIYLSTYLSTCLSVCLSIYLFICLSIHLSVYLSNYMSVCLSVCLFIYLSIYLSTNLSIHLSIYPSIYAHMHMSTHTLDIFMPHASSGPLATGPLTRRHAAETAELTKEEVSELPHLPFVRLVFSQTAPVGIHSSMLWAVLTPTIGRSFFLGHPKHGKSPSFNKVLKQELCFTVEARKLQL